ncbi:leucine-rich repeat-containing protein 56 isoform X2 [Lemur catta]|uniref:leucine-rich repeat-containing protein 56 isoform X2 n=1 Tax=Lemur catta TaxID=9447 RepID=UPI001E26A14D|nr:leucine-rich repeat-containing protein 56 isoform X2 [Lemur catta]
MDPAWDRSRGPRPSTASIRVRELSWQGLRNPCPQSKGLGSHGGSRREQLVEHYLSPARLQALARVDDLQLVRVLEMCVDTREGSLGNFGVHLPNLNQLKLNGSRLGSLRDLGTSLGRLQVLWLARCGLNDLDGIGSFPALKELYVSYNNISDLSPLCLLEQLEVLDLEGNSVEDLGQVRYLQLCPRLATLTLEGNLVCLRPAPDPSNKAPRDYNYRAEVKKLVPQLQVLDEVPATRPGPPATLTLTQDWLVVKEAIQKGSVLPWLDCLRGAPMQRLDPELSLPETQPRAPRPWPFSLLVPGGPLPQGLLPEDPAPADNASNLTHGTWGPSRKGPQPPGAHEGPLKSKTTRLSPRLPAAPRAWPQVLSLPARPQCLRVTPHPSAMQGPHLRPAGVSLAPLPQLALRGADRKVLPWGSGVHNLGRQSQVSRPRAMDLETTWPGHQRDRAFQKREQARCVSKPRPGCQQAGRARWAVVRGRHQVEGGRQVHFRPRREGTPPHLKTGPVWAWGYRIKQAEPSLEDVGARLNIAARQRGPSPGLVGKPGVGQQGQQDRQDTAGRAPALPRAGWYLGRGQREERALRESRGRSAGCLVDKGCRG